MTLSTKPTVMKYPHFAEIKTNIALDPSFQVGSYDEGRWTKTNQTMFIESIMMNMATQPIILVNISACLENCIEGTADYKYFKDWLDKGYEWISVDGNNRSISIHDFYNDKVRLHLRKRYQVEVANGRVVDFTLTPDDCYYSTIPDALRTKFDESEVSVVVVTRATRQDLTDLFIRVNSGVGLNGAEKRNAIISLVSETVRSLATKYSSVGESFMSQKSMTRLGFYESVTSWLVHYTHQDSPVTIDNGALDRAYASNSAAENNIVPFAKLAESVLKGISNSTGRFSRAKMKKYNLHNFFFLLTYLDNNNYDVKDWDKFVLWFVQSEISRCNSQEIAYTNSKGYVKVYEELTTDESNTIFARLKMLRHDFLESTLEDDGVVISKDKNRIATPKQRYQLWETQGGICPLSKKRIPLDEILDANKWQADHILEHSRGGKTEIENMQLVCIESHRQKTGDFLRVS